jgi:phosphate transport system protein
VADLAKQGDMNQLETEIYQLKEAISDMMALAALQLEKSQEAFEQSDTELAEEILHSERRMNAMELSIDRDCENIFALWQPVATDLRFVIAMLKINSDLERIGDYSAGIASYIVEMDDPISKDFLNKTKILEMFEIAISMTHDIRTAFEEGDTKLARKVYKKDTALNKLKSDGSVVVAELIQEHPEKARTFLFLFSTIRKLERVGDHVKNVAEDIIFHHEAKVYKKKKRSSEGA